MLNKLKQRKQEGFTIIEVMIVLAIAGLIMVVVFIAVPGLQRSQRNQALDEAAQNVLTSVGEYTSNNAGNVPAVQTAAAVSGSTVTIGASGTNQSTAKFGSNTITNFSVGGTAIAATAAVGTTQVITGTTAVCNSNANGLSGTGTARSYVVLYVAESGGSGNLLKCIGS